VLNEIRALPRNLRRERRLWSDATRNALCLGCTTCRSRAVCGGLHPDPGLFDCTRFCCGAPMSCDRVCRHSPDYADRVREVGGFNFDNIARNDTLVAPPLPGLMPVVFHGSRRARNIPAGAVALPLQQALVCQLGTGRQDRPLELRAAFGLAPDTTIILSGVGRDAALERWWSLGEDARRAMIRRFKEAGVSLVTSPNFSLFSDRPRWDDLHAMKRIALAHQEFLSEGLPAALHVNGRDEFDFERWAAFIAAREEITHLSYEFATGAGWAGRRAQHAAWLGDIALAAGRPLHLMVRGGAEVLPSLARSFARITLLDTSVFMKTMMRQKVECTDPPRLTWVATSTEAGAPLDDLFAENLSAVEAWYNQVVDGVSQAAGVAA